MKSSVPPRTATAELQAIREGSDGPWWWPFRDRFDLALMAIAAAYVLVAPFTKVEESFNAQATHDFLVHGLDFGHYDHVTFPGVVPRTFIGPLLLAVPTYCIQWVAHLVWLLFDLLSPRILPIAAAIVLSLSSLFPLMHDAAGRVGLAALLSRPPVPVPLSQLLLLHDAAPPSQLKAAYTGVLAGVASVWTAFCKWITFVLPPRVWRQAFPFLFLDEPTAPPTVTAAAATAAGAAAAAGSSVASAAAAAAPAICVGCMRDDRLWLLMVARLVLALASVASLIALRRALAKTFAAKLPGVDKTFVLISAVQFHLLFYAGRPLPNVFALILVTFALASWLSGEGARAVGQLTAACVIFRCDMVIFALPLLVAAVVRDRLPAEGSGLFASTAATVKPSFSDPFALKSPLGVSLATVFASGSVASVLYVGAVLLVDSPLWGRWPMWPELTVLLFNTVDNRSSEWGTSPPHWYFTSALPRLLAFTLPLVPLGVLSVDGLANILSLARRALCRPLAIMGLAPHDHAVAAAPAPASAPIPAAGAAAAAAAKDGASGKSSAKATDKAAADEAAKVNKEASDKKDEFRLPFLPPTKAEKQAAADAAAKSKPPLTLLKHLDIDSLTLLLPALAFVALYSVLPHKELRFILPAVPLFNAVAAFGLCKLMRASRWTPVQPAAEASKPATAVPADKIAESGSDAAATAAATPAKPMPRFVSVSASAAPASSSSSSAAAAASGQPAAAGAVITVKASPAPAGGASAPASPSSSSSSSSASAATAAAGEAKGQLKRIDVDQLKRVDVDSIEKQRAAAAASPSPLPASSATSAPSTASATAAASSSSSSSPSRPAEQRPSRMAISLLAVLLFLTLLYTHFSLAVSARNYPGGHAMVRLNQAIILSSIPISAQQATSPQGQQTAPVRPPQALVRVHLGNAACTTGVTRFGERYVFGPTDAAAHTHGLYFPGKALSPGDVAAAAAGTGAGSLGGDVVIPDDVATVIDMESMELFTLVGEETTITPIPAGQSPTPAPEPEAKEEEKQQQQQQQPAVAAPPAPAGSPAKDTQAPAAPSSAPTTAADPVFASPAPAQARAGQVRVEYSKEEGLPAEVLHAHPLRFDWVVGEAERVPGFRLVDTIPAFKGVSLLVPAADGSLVRVYGMQPQVQHTHGVGHGGSGNSRGPSVDALEDAAGSNVVSVPMSALEAAAYAAQALMSWPPRIPFLHVVQLPSLFIHKREGD